MSFRNSKINIETKSLRKIMKGCKAGGGKCYTENHCRKSWYWYKNIICKLDMLFSYENIYFQFIFIMNNI